MNCTTELSQNIEAGRQAMKDLAEQEAAATARFHEQRLEHVKRLCDRSRNDFVTSTDVNNFLGDTKMGSFACVAASNLLKELTRTGDIRVVEIYDSEHTCTTGDDKGKAYYGPGFPTTGKMKKGYYFSKQASFADNPRQEIVRKEVHKQAKKQAEATSNRQRILAERAAKKVAREQKSLHRVQESRASQLHQVRAKVVKSAQKMTEERDATSIARWQIRMMDPAKLKKNSRLSVEEKAAVRTRLESHGIKLNEVRFSYVIAQAKVPLLVNVNTLPRPKCV